MLLPSLSCSFFFGQCVLGHVGPSSYSQVDDYLHELYKFSSAGICYLCRLLDPKNSAAYSTEPCGHHPTDGLFGTWRRCCAQNFYSINVLVKKKKTYHQHVPCPCENKGLNWDSIPAFLSHVFLVVSSPAEGHLEKFRRSLWRHCAWTVLHDISCLRKESAPRVALEIYQDNTAVIPDINGRVVRCQ